MPKVKICGITNLQDAQCAVAAGADALGFVFYAPSPRYIDPLDARTICDALPAFTLRVGLFVNTSPQEINRICHTAGLHVAQIHFDVDAQFLEQLKVPYLRVVRATCRDDIGAFSDEYRIVDAFVAGYGGEGVRIDLDWFARVDCSRIILAGGLDADNIDELKDMGFYGFDVSSGVEISKGKKDCKKIQAFIKKARFEEL